MGLRGGNRHGDIWNTATNQWPQIHHQLQPVSQKDLDTHQFPKNQSSRPCSSQMALFPQCGELWVELWSLYPQAPVAFYSAGSDRVFREAMPGLQRLILPEWLVLGGAGPTVVHMDDTPCGGSDNDPGGSLWRSTSRTKPPDGGVQNQ